MIRHSNFEFRISPQGFTLTELLVVIGIIIILIGILLPVVSKIRMAAFTADTQNEISQISNACSSYYSTYHAYPGPFSNDETATGTPSTPVGAATLQYIYLNGGYGPLTNDSAYKPAKWVVTGAENLVLGLMGGLRPVPIPPAAASDVLAFAPQEVGLGPLSLNPSNPARDQSYFSTGSNYLMWCQANGASTPQTVQTTGAYQAVVTTGSPPTPVFTGTVFTDPAGTEAGDCPIPVLVDRYPSPLPILYLRARTGAPGVVSDGKYPNPNTGSIALYQYDVRDITPYVRTHIGLVAENKWGQAVTHNLTDIGTTFSGPVPSLNALNANETSTVPNPVVNAGLYFINQSITPTGTPNDTGRPRAVDQFILISAGPDGIYGTPDDITSFGNVSQ